MSSYNRRSFLALPLVALVAACGFTPVHGPGGAGEALYGKVNVAAPETVESYLLVQRLEEKLGRGVDPTYDLSLGLNIQTQGQAITPTDAITRHSVIGRLNYTMTSRETGQVVASGNVENFTGFSATGDTVETLAADRDARQRLMVILADQLAVELYTKVDVPS